MVVGEKEDAGIRGRGVNLQAGHAALPARSFGGSPDVNECSEISSRTMEMMVNRMCAQRIRLRTHQGRFI